MSHTVVLLLLFEHLKELLARCRKSQPSLSHASSHYSNCRLHTLRRRVDRLADSGRRRSRPWLATAVQACVNACGVELLFVTSNVPETLEKCLAQFQKLRQKAHMEPSRRQLRSLDSTWTSSVNPQAPWPEYPRPQLQREQWLNLNGIWEFAGSF